MNNFADCWCCDDISGDPHTVPDILSKSCLNSTNTTTASSSSSSMVPWEGVTVTTIFLTTVLPSSSSLDDVF